MLEGSVKDYDSPRTRMSSMASHNVSTKTVDMEILQIIVTVTH